MKASSTAVDAYHLRVMVERMQREGRSEEQIVSAVEESSDRRPIAAARPAPHGWRTRLIPARRSG